MSTTSSALNSLASATVLDFLGRRAGNTVLQAKVATLAWGVVVMGAGLLAWRLGSILELIVKVNSYFYGCLLGVFLLGMLTERAIAAGARFGLIAGMAAVLTLLRLAAGIVDLVRRGRMPGMHGRGLLLESMEIR